MQKHLSELKKMKDKCSTPFCRGEQEICVMGKWFCQECRKKQCTEELEDWKQKQWEKTLNFALGGK